jgi:hypothetical protein
VVLVRAERARLQRRERAPVDHRRSYLRAEGGPGRTLRGHDPRPTPSGTPSRRSLVLPAHAHRVPSFPTPSSASSLLLSFAESLTRYQAAPSFGDPDAGAQSHGHSRCRRRDHKSAT